MAAKPLTKAEKAWVKKLQKVLNECPSVRMGSYTTGDPYVTIYDKDVQDEWEDMTGETDDKCIMVDDANSKLYVLTFPFQVDSTAG